MEIEGGGGGRAVDVHWLGGAVGSCLAMEEELLSIRSMRVSGGRAGRYIFSASYVLPFIRRMSLRWGLFKLLAILSHFSGVEGLRA